MLAFTFVGYSVEKPAQTYNQILDGTLSDVRSLERNLSTAERATKKTKTLLATTVIEVAQAEVKLDMLQVQINTMTEELNKQITLAQTYKEKYEITKEKLSWWHKLASYVSVGIVLCIAYFVLKATGRI